MIGFRSSIAAVWAADGTTPILDANLELRPGDGDCSQLGLLGCFRLPGAVDYADLERVAQETTTDLLRRIATALHDGEGTRLLTV